MLNQCATKGEVLALWRLLKSDQQKGQAAKSPGEGEEFKLTAIKNQFHKRALKNNSDMFHKRSKLYIF